LTIIIIALLVITVTIPSRNAPYFLILIFGIYQVVLIVRNRIKLIEDYYLGVIELPSTSGKLVDCTLEVPQLLELDFTYKDGHIFVSDAVAIKVDLDEDVYNKIYLFDITSEDVGNVLDIKIFDGSIYVFKKESEEDV
jgi:hypothetical protein